MVELEGQDEMKRLFLASSGLEYIKKFIGRDPSGVRMLFIPTAGNLDTDVWWIDKDRDVLSKMGFDIRELDIAHSHRNEMKRQLDDSEIVYVAGGNTFYLLKQMQMSGFGELLTTYVENGGLYAGASAGALIAGADIGPIASIDEPEKVEGLASTRGLGFVDVVPIPHYDMGARTDTINAIQDQYAGKYEFVLLTDDDALEVTDDTWRVVESKRGTLEHEWFDKHHTS